jgi:hypothetical protein
MLIFFSFFPLTAPDRLSSVFFTGKSYNVIISTHPFRPEGHSVIVIRAKEIGSAMFAV